MELGEAEELRARVALGIVVTIVLACVLGVWGGYVLWNRW
jgi:hypothetical protein